MFGKNQIVGQKYFNEVTDDKLFVTSVFFTLQGEGPYRGKPAIFVRVAKCNLACSFCFVDSTKISMWGGTQKKIKDVNIGDEVVSFDEKTQTFVKGTVSRLYKSTVDSVLNIRNKNGGNIYVTHDHPFLIKNKGWVKAKDILLGDIMLHFSTSSSNNGEVVDTITEIQKGSGHAWTRLAGQKDNSTTVYNFEVENYHTYVANGKIVHNCDTFFDDGDWLNFDQIDQKITQTIDDFYAKKGIAVPQWAKDRKMVLVITGGEPMLQKKIGGFLKTVGATFSNMQIESNGTLLQEIPESTTLVVSPKCSEKNGKALKYLQLKPEVLARATCLKFVMSAEQDSPYSSIPEWAHEWAATTGKEVFISPMNMYHTEPQKSKQLRANSTDITLDQRSTIDEVISFWDEGLLDMKQNQKNHEYAARYCIEHGFILNLQLQLYASVA